MSTVHVGIPPTDWESWESRFIHFHHFESLPIEEDQSVKSPLFRCFNHEWALLIYPGGKNGSSRGGRMAFYLRHYSDREISVDFGLLIRDANGDAIFEKETSHVFRKKGASYGWKNSIKIAKIVDASSDILRNGTLTVEVRIKPDEDHYCLNFIPKKETSLNILRSFMDENTADVVFEVKSKSKGGKRELFYVHKLVLQLCAGDSTLSSLCEDCDEDEHVPLLDVDPLVCRLMLYYVYGGSIDAVEWRNHAKNLIDAADRYGVKNLKIEAEAWYVKHHKITVDNAINTLHYSCEKNCFLLQEATTNFVLRNARELQASDSFNNMPVPSIVREIVSLASTMKIQAEEKKEFGDPTKLSINELRAKLYDDGKDIDGPRNRLIAQLRPKKTKNPSKF